MQHAPARPLSTSLIGAMLRMLLAFALAAGLAAPATAAATNAQTAWRLLDYMAVDYRGAVVGRQDRQRAEYRGNARIFRFGRRALAALPANPAKPSLLVKARALQFGDRFESGRPARRDRAPRPRPRRAVARRLSGPARAAQIPDPARGARLYAAELRGLPRRRRRCRHGDGAPARSASDRLHRPRRAAIAAVRPLPGDRPGARRHADAELGASCRPQDRWALAFTVGRFAYPDALAEQGEASGTSDAGLRARIPNIETLAGTLPGKAWPSRSARQARRALTAFLRADPEAAMQRGGTSRCRSAASC